MARSSLQRIAEHADLLRVAAQFTWQCGADYRIDVVDLLDPSCGEIVIQTLQGLRLDRLGQKALYPAERRMLAEVLEDGRDFADMSLTLPRPEAAPVYLTLSATARCDGDGRFRGYVGVGRASSERRFDALQRQELIGLLHRAEAARDREQRMRRESEALLASLRVLVEPLPFAERGRTILRSFEPLLACEAAFVIRRGIAGGLRTVVSTLDQEVSDVWPEGPALLSALAGQATVHDNLSAENLAGIPLQLRKFAKAALFAPLQIGREHAVLVALHSRPGSFGEEHLAIMQRLGLVAGQAFMAEENKTALVNASKLATLGELLAAIAHEINQPLSIIAMAVQNAKFLIECDGTREELMEKLERSEAQAYRAGEIVNAIRNLAHPNHVATGPSRVEVPEILQGLKILTDSALRAKGITLAVELPEPCRGVIANVGALQQVLLNLVVNARDAVSDRLTRDGLKSGGRIVIAVNDSASADRLLIQVSDNGGGIPNDLLERIFDPFFTMKEVGKGTGLGLSICRTLLADMGANLSVHNGNDGAVFEIDLAAA
jgi:signal transduction histidine kinase